MSDPINNGFDDSWERVADELRACKESQRRAWGDIDATTLGRYLAGDVRGEELSQIEQSLCELPELRKLTDLVRDVLQEVAPLVEPVAQSAASLPAPSSTPTTRLPDAMLTQIVPLVRPLASAPPSRRLWQMLRQYGSLAAAACVLVAVTALWPQSGYLSAPRGEQGLERAVAMARFQNPPAGLFETRELFAASEALPIGDASKPAEADGRAELMRMVPQAQWPQEQPVDRKAVNEWHKQALHYRDRGDLCRAEKNLANVQTYCEANLGPQHPGTRVSTLQLAGVYEAAIQQLPTAQSAKMVASASTSLTAPAYARNAPPGYGPMAAGSNHTLGASPQQPPLPPSLSRGRVPVAMMKKGVPTLAYRLSQQPMGEVQTTVVPVLAKALQIAPTSQERVALVRALGRLGPAAAPSVGILADRLEKSDQPAEQREILVALDNIGAAARDAVPVLGRLVACEQKGSDKQEPRFAAREQQQAAQLLKKLQSRQGKVCITDPLKVFSLQAVCEANEQLRRVAQANGVEVIIVTAETSAVGATPASGKTVQVTLVPSRGKADVFLSEELRRDLATEPRDQTKFTLTVGKDHDLLLRQAVQKIEDLTNDRRAEPRPK